MQLFETPSTRNACLVHDGASYQFAPEGMSRRPSRLTSRTAAVSVAPGSIAWIRNGTSGGRVAASESAAQARISRGARRAALTSTRAISSRPLEREPQRKLDDAARAGAGGGAA